MFKQCLQWLEEANTELGAIISENPVYCCAGDVFFNGDVTKWRKAVNSLSTADTDQPQQKEADTDLKIKDKFNAIVSNPSKYPVMTGNGDNMSMTYNSSHLSNNFPIWPDDSKVLCQPEYTRRYLGQYPYFQKDARIFKIASPATGIAEDPLNPFARYKGAKMRRYSK